MNQLEINPNPANKSEIPFGSLVMDQLEISPIPAKISSLESDGSGFEEFEVIVENGRVDEKSYLRAFTALIHMEEACDTKRVQIMELKNVVFLLESKSEQIFSTLFNVSMINFTPQNVSLIFD